MDDRVEIWEPAVYAAARGDGGGYDEILEKAGARIFGV
jgi:hypothetical protein